MAEALFRTRLPEDLRGRTAAASAGSAAVEGAPAAPHALEVAAAAGIDLSPHRARRYSPEMAAQADLVLALDAGNRAWVLAQSPQHSARIFCLREAASSGAGENISIRDPFGGDLEGYRTCFAEIEQEIERLMTRLRCWLEGDPLP